MHDGSIDGVGLALSTNFIQRQDELQAANLAFLEMAPEPFMGAGGKVEGQLDQLLEHVAVLTHGTSLSLAASEPQSATHLARLREVVRRTNTPWHSDHLSFSTIGAINLHELLPPPLTVVSAQLVAYRMRRIQDLLGLPLAAANIAFYGHFLPPQMSELEWLLSVLDVSQGQLVLDINSVYVNSVTFGFDAAEFIRQIPADKICQLQLGGFEQTADGRVLASLGGPVAQPVLRLFEQTLRRIGPRPVTLVWKRNNPTLSVLLAEVSRLQQRYDRVMSEPHQRAV